MKKSTYLVIAAAALGMVACTGNKAGYVIIGVIENAADGDTAYLRGATGRNPTKPDTTVISRGTFTFEGTRDSAVDRYVIYEVSGEPLMIDFFLESGKINIALAKDSDPVIDTSNDDAYQAIRTQTNDISQKIDAIYEAMGDSPLSDEQKEAKRKEGAQLEEEYGKVIKEGVQEDITNPVGVFSFKQTFYSNSTKENAALLEQIPTDFRNGETTAKVEERTEKQKKIAMGTKFVDFEIQTPEGKTVKLPDYAGKGKVVLVDFWASWRGPRRREIPGLVEVYAQYKGKNFEIVGVSLDQDVAVWREPIKKLNMVWPQTSDPKFWQDEGAQPYAVNSIPHTVLIDGDGTIIAHGPHGEGLQARLTEVVK